MERPGQSLALLPSGIRLGPPNLRRRQVLTLALLFAAGVVNFFDRSSLAVANSTIRAHMHLSGTQMGWLLTAFSLAYGVAQLPLVALLPQFGARFVLGAGLALWSTAQALTGAVRGMPSFLALRALLGIGESPFYPAGVQSVGEWFPPGARGRATAVMSTSQTLGLAVAPPFLAWLILRTGWRAMFVLLGAAGLLVAAGWIAFYRTNTAPLPTDVPPDPGSSVPHQSGWSTLLRRRTVWGMMLGFGGINYTSWLYTSWIPGYLQTARHLSLVRTGWVASIPFLAGAAGMLLSGTTADRFAQHGLPLSTVHRTQIVAGMLTSAACTFCVARSGSTAAAVAGISGALFAIQFAGTSG